ncbi:MAG: hypothetical protein RBT65_10695 [Methanolobus sp.]|jgi:hypothetical protein|nr:hypothetical protein [Methanolobus sp.]
MDTDEHEIKLANWLSTEIITYSKQLFPLMEFVEAEGEIDGGSKVYRYDEPIPEAGEILGILSAKYEEWCTKCRPLLKKYFPGELEDFNRSHDVIKNVLSFEYRIKIPNTNKAYMEFHKHIMTQVTIASHLSKKLKK